MKKLFFIMAMSVCAFTAQAQTTSGIRVGLNMTSATGKYNDLMADQDYNNKSYMGYSIHYFIDVPVIGNFTIQPYQQIFLASNQFSLLLTKPANLNTYFISRINIPG